MSCEHLETFDQETQTELEITTLTSSCRGSGRDLSVIRVLVLFI